LTQTAGRAARNSNGLVLFYADKITNSMQRTIDETNRRRSIQIEYNTVNGITPRTVSRTREEIINASSILDIRGKQQRMDSDELTQLKSTGDPIIEQMNAPQLEKLLTQTEKKMKEAAKDLDFISAAQYRDEMLGIKRKLKEKFGVV
jgi:excinuclease ABC subunit B